MTFVLVLCPFFFFFFSKINEYDDDELSVISSLDPSWQAADWRVGQTRLFDRSARQPLSRETSLPCVLHIWTHARAIVEKVMGNKGHKMCRLDGRIRTIKSLTSSQMIRLSHCSCWQLRLEVLVYSQVDCSRLQLGILTQEFPTSGFYQASSLSISPAADRVVIIDPSWNPAIDSQAVDRAFHIGQTMNVV